MAVKKPKFGAKQRFENRQKEIKRRKKSVEKRVNNKFMPLLSLGKISTTDLKNHINNFIDVDLKAEGQPYKIHAYNYIINIIEHGVKKDGWEIAIPPKITPEKVNHQFRNEEWFVKCGQFCSLINAIKNHFETVPEGTVDENDIVAMLVISGASYGGLNSSTKMVAYINQLINEDMTLKRVGNTYWLDLVLDDESLPFNYLLGKKKLHLHRWFPDTISLIWMVHYFGIHEHKPKQISEDSLWCIVQTFIAKLSLKFELDCSLLSNLKEFCLAGIGFTERLPGVYLNQTLTRYAQGKLESSSLPTESFETILKGNFPSPDLSKKYHRVNYCQQTTSESFLGDLHSILYFQKGVKPNKNMVIKDLYEVEIDDENYHQATFLNWLIFNLEEKGNSVKVAYNILCAIGKYWVQAKDNDVDVKDPESLTDFYYHIIQEKKREADEKLKKKERENKSITSSGGFDNFITSLSRFHQYACYKNYFADVDVFEGYKKSRQFKRAGFIPEVIFEKFLHELNGSHSYQQYIPMMACFFIILYRSGLRISEVEGLRFRDVYISDDIWIYVKNNRHNSIKSSSGYRKVPLGLLLKDYEKDVLTDFISRKQKKHNVTQSSLLFSFDTAPNHHMGSRIKDHFFGSCMSKVTSFPFVIHHFRHTALSKLHLIISQNIDVFNLVDIYRDNEIKNIQQILTHHNKNAFWNLASIAAHPNPEVTFNHYFHFTDLILNSQLKKHNGSLKYNELLAYSGLSRRRLNTLLNTKTKKDKLFLLEEVHNVLEGVLAKYSNEISLGTKSSPFRKMPVLKYLVTPYDMTLLLKDIESGKTSKEVANENNLDLCEVNKWVEISEYIFKEKASGKMLSPKEPQTKAELFKINTIFLEAKKVFETQTAEFKWAIKYYIKNYNGSVVKFADPQNLNRFLSILSIFFSKPSQIVIDIRLPLDGAITETKKKWSDAISRRARILRDNYLHQTFKIKKEINDKKNQGERDWSGHARSKTFINRPNKYPHGLAILSVRNPKEKIRIEQNKEKGFDIGRYSSNVMTFSFLSFAIYYFDSINELIELE